MITMLELPGLRKSDIAITARPNGELVVSGERRPQHLSYIAGLMDVEPETVKDNGRTVFNELKFGRFQRVFKLPEDTDVSHSVLFSVLAFEVDFFVSLAFDDLGINGRRHAHHLVA